MKNIHRPSIEVYLPDASKANRTALLIAPGGAYRHLAIDKEGYEVARWLNSMGVAAFVLKYRLPKTEGHSYTNDTALADAEKAIHVIRENAARWNIAPERVGMVGFSAGGNLTIRAGLELDDPPNFLAPIYPVAPDELPVTAGSPPAFIVHADDDRLSSKNSVRFYLALKKAGVPAELHIYAEGGHGFGIRDRGLPVSGWRRRFADWMRAGGWLKE